MSEQVTKSKNEGRVAAGKKLAEWNRKNKENLLKNKDQVAVSDRLAALQEQPQSQASSDRLAVLQEQPQSQASIYSGAVMVFAVIGVALYLALPRRQSAPATPVVQDNIFSMN